MKQEKAKSTKIWLPLLIGLVVLLAVVGVVLAMVLQPGQQTEAPTEPVGGRPMLYWNVDRQTYQGDEESIGLSTREPAEDGLYHIRFAFDGELVEYTTADKRLVNVIDTLDVMSLVLDGDDIVDAVDPESIATEVYDGVIVKSLKGNVLMANTSLAMNGMDAGMRLCDLTKIINVDLNSDKLGQLDELEPMDRITVYSNKNEEITHIFMTKRRPALDVYWRADKFYDAAAGETTRTPDANGVYTIPFALKGKQVELKCRDKELVSEIDAPLIYGCPMGLVFDEDGYIVEIVDAGVALRGMLLASGHNITAIDGDTITCTYLLPGNNTGEEKTFTIPENCEIYNCCIGGSAEYIGEPTELQLLDRVMVFTDLEGTPVLIYVMYRMANTPMYYNMTQMYNWETGETTRVPDANGYYVFKMSVQGKQVTLRTKDKALATKIDAVSYKLMGLQVEGDIIKRFYTPYVVCGADTYSAGTARFVTDITGTIVSSVSLGGDYAAPSNLLVTSTTEVYDITGYPGTKVGEKTTVQKGDQVLLLVDYNNNISHMYVTQRYTGWPVYYNYTRMYGTGGTTRQPDAEGYYVYQMATGGKSVEVKTKDKTLADYIDLQYPGIVALDVKGGIIKNAAPAVTSMLYGRMTDYTARFTQFNDDATYSFTLPSTGKTYSVGVVEKPVVYNCSAIVKNFVGEKGSVQEGDQLISIMNDQIHKVEQIFILSRKVASKFYYVLSPQYNSVTKESTRQPDAEGYYVFSITVEGQIKQFKTKSKDIATAVDSKGAMPFGMTVSGDVITGAFPYNYIKGVKAMAGYSLDIDQITSAGKVEMTVYLPTSDSFGKSLSLPLAANYKAYDVSAYAADFGKQVKLNKGDRVVCFTNEKDQVEWFYIWYRNTHEKGAISYCDHCGKNVYWQPFTGSAYQVDTHVYLTHNMTAGSVLIGNGNPSDKQAELVLDLNGKTLSTVGNRSFIVQSGTLSVVDTVGGGKVVGRTDPENKVTGANIMVLSGGTLNLYSGTLCGSDAQTQIADAGVVFVGADSTFNMYGGTVADGKVTGKGGNIYCDTGTFNMYGGTVTGGKAGVGGNLYLGAATFKMEGGTIVGDAVLTSPDAKITIGGDAKITKGAVSGLQMAAGVKLPLGAFTQQTKVTVDASGVFTDQLTNPESYLSNVTAFDSTFPVFVHEGALACGRVEKCEECGEEVFWTRFSAAACTGEAHLVLTEDTTLDAWILLNEQDKIVLDLNGKTLSAGEQADRLFVVYGSLSVQDSATGGKLVGRVNDKTDAAGLVMLQNPGKMNLYSGSLCAGETAELLQSGGLVYAGYNTTFNMYGGTVTGGQAQLGGNIFGGEGSVINILGGEVALGTATNGGNIYAKNAVVNIGAEQGQTATVTGGQAFKGGNIYSAKVDDGNADTDENRRLSVLKTAVISDGKAVATADDTNSAGGNIFTEQVLMAYGTITGGKASDGGNIYATTWTGIGGTVTKGEASHRGGNIFAAGTLEIAGEGAQVTEGKALYGGNILATLNVTVYENTKVSGGTATDTAGNIYMVGATTLTVRGEISDGVAPVGGNIVTVNNAKLTVNGGSITGGSFKLGTGVVFTVAGAAKIDSLALADGQKLTLGELTEDASVTLAATGAFTEANEKAGEYAAYFHPVAASPEVEAHVQDNMLIFGIKRYCEHCEAEIVWSEFSADSCTGNKHLMVTQDTQLASTILINAGDNVVIDLNGHTLSLKDSADRMFINYGTLSVQDSKTGGKMVGRVNASTGDSGLILLQNPGVLNLYSGTLSGSTAATAIGNGGVVYVGSGSTFNLHGGTVTEGKVTGKGGNVFCQSGTFNMLGGELTKGAANQGGNLYVGTFTMKGGKIADGTATEGGNVYTVSGTFNQEGGTIENGVASGKGGNLYAHSTVLNIGTAQGETVVITGGQAHKGGNIYVAKVDDGDASTDDNRIFTLSAKAQITNGTALVENDTTTAGGNIYTEQVLLSYGSVTGGKAADGGNIYAMTWTGIYGPVTGGEATKRGGNIFANGTLEIVGAAAKVEGGKAAEGGNIMALYNTLVGTGAKVTGGEATVAAGNVYLVTANTLTVQGEISGGVAPVGGNIATVNNAKLTVNGGTVTGGSFKLGTGVVFTVAGAAKIDSLVLAEGQKLTLGEMTEGASVTLEATGAFTVANEKAADYESYFHSAVVLPDVGTHAVDNMLIFGIERYCSHCQKDVLWDTFSAEECKGKKHLILKASEELASTILLNAGDDVVIDLNGYTLSLKESADRMFIVYGTLSVQDTKTGGKMVGRVNASTGDSGLMLLQNPGVLNLYSGTLSGSTAATAIANGGVVYVGSGCTFNLHGGAVADGKVTGVGGNVFCQYGTFNMLGGELRNGAANQGGNLYAGNFTMQGGTITGGHTTASGGNIYLTGTATVKGATITGGVGTTGGNICLQGTTTAYTNLQVTDSTISGGQATSTAAWSGGGNIVAYNANITLTGTRVEGGSAGLCGGNILVGNASLTLANGSVSHGGTLTATSGTKLGPNICKFDSGDLKILSGATVSGDWMWMNNSTSTTAKLVMEGNINVYFEVGAGPIDATVSGAVKVQSLVLPTGCKLTLGELTEGASIKVTASGVFTNASDKAEEYKKYFLPVEKITVVGNALSMGA